MLPSSSLLIATCIPIILKRFVKPCVFLWTPKQVKSLPSPNSLKASTASQRTISMQTLTWGLSKWVLYESLTFAILSYATMYLLKPNLETFTCGSNLKEWMVLMVQHTQALDAFTVGMPYAGLNDGVHRPLLKLQQVHRRWWKMHVILRTAPARRTPCGAMRQFQLPVIVWIKLIIFSSYNFFSKWSA